MQKFLRNVSGRTVWNRIQLVSVAESADKIVSRKSSTLSYVQQPVLRYKFSWNHTRIQPAQLPNLHSSFYSTDSDKPPNNDESGSTNQPPWSKLFDQDMQSSPPPLSFFTVSLNAWKIRNALDREFNLNEFVDGTKQAVEVVSDRLALADFKGLSGLVTDDLLKRLRDPINSMNKTQRDELRVTQDDIVKQIVSTIDFKEKDDSAIVEISMIYHIVRGFKRLEDEFSKTPSEFLKHPSKFVKDENLFILNYTFAKEFSKESNDDWIVSQINHMNIAAVMLEHNKNFLKIFETIIEEKDKNDKKK